MAAFGTMTRMLLTILAAGALTACGSSAPPPAAKADAVLFSDIYVAYRDRPAAAVEQFGEGVFDVSGRIDSIELAGDLGELFLTGPHRTVGAVHFADPAGAQDELAKVRKGDWITVRCRAAKPLGDTMFDLNECGSPRKTADPGTLV